MEPHTCLKARVGIGPLLLLLSSTEMWTHPVSDVKVIQNQHVSTILVVQSYINM